MILLHYIHRLPDWSATGCRCVHQTPEILWGQSCFLSCSLLAPLTSDIRHNTRIKVKQAEQMAKSTIGNLAKSEWNGLVHSILQGWWGKWEHCRWTYRYRCRDGWRLQIPGIPPRLPLTSEAFLDEHRGAFSTKLIPQGAPLNTRGDPSSQRPIRLNNTSHTAGHRGGLLSWTVTMYIQLNPVLLNPITTVTSDAQGQHHPLRCEYNCLLIMKRTVGEVRNEWQWLEQDDSCDVEKALWRTCHGLQAWETNWGVWEYTRGHERGEREKEEGVWVTENKNKQACRHYLQLWHTNINTPFRIFFFYCLLCIAK